jgi:hypothetical protein
MKRLNDIKYWICHYQSIYYICSAVYLNLKFLRLTRTNKTSSISMHVDLCNIAFLLLMVCVVFNIILLYLLNIVLSILYETAFIAALCQVK